LEDRPLIQEIAKRIRRSKKRELKDVLREPPNQVNLEERVSWEVLKKKRPFFSPSPLIAFSET
jgi:hypothetical protein